MKLLTAVLGITTIVFAFLYFSSVRQNSLTDKSKPGVINAELEDNSSKEELYNKKKEAKMLHDYQQLVELFKNKQGTMTDSIKLVIAKLTAGHFNDVAWANEYVAHYGVEMNGPLRLTKMGKSVWFDLDCIKNMYDFLIKNQCDGLRIYFGKYSKYVIDATSQNHDAQRDDNGDYDGRFSAILVTTKNNKQDYIKKIISFKDSSLNKIFKDMLKNNLLDGPYDGIYNYSQLCPPNTNCVSSAYIK